VYKQLKSWHDMYGEQIALLLYPSDEFGAQELPSDQIPGFVAGEGLPTDGAGCTLMEKVSVNGPSADPVWKFAKEAFPGDVQWNFHGIFLFNADGKTVGRYTPQEMSKLDTKLRVLVAAAKSAAAKAAKVDL